MNVADRNPARIAHLAPRQRLKRTKAGRYINDITYEELSQWFHLPSGEACVKLGVGLTILKRICRRFGLPRWPYVRKSLASSEQRASAVTTRLRSLHSADDTQDAGVATYDSPTAIATYGSAESVGFRTKLPAALLSPPPPDNVPRPQPRRISAKDPAVLEATLRSLGLAAPLPPAAPAATTPVRHNESASLGRDPAAFRHSDSVEAASLSGSEGRAPKSAVLPVITASTVDSAAAALEALPQWSRAAVEALLLFAADLTSADGALST